MTKQQTGTTMLVAGTCIGSGMIALPMTLAKIGIIPSILLMTFTWIIMYLSSLIISELNLQSGKALALGGLARKFSGRKAELLGSIFFKILSFSLVAVYIYAGSSVCQKLIESTTEQEYSFQIIVNIYSFLIFLIFLCPIKQIDYINRLLFTNLIAVISVLIIGLISLIEWHNLPLFSENYSNIATWQVIIPIVFTSFGFQGSCHSFANFCQLNKYTLNKALFWGSLLPLIVYIIWNTSAISVVYTQNPAFFAQMVEVNVEVGELIEQLAKITKWKSLQILVWWITIFAIITSLLGVGIGLFDSIKLMLPEKTPKIVPAILTILPAHILATLTPNAFITILGFAGMILAFIAIILPIYLLYKTKIKLFNYNIIKSKYIVCIVWSFGIIVILAEISNILTR